MSAADPGQSSQRILIVEDEAKLASLLQDYLQASGFSTHILMRGDEVIDWLRQNQADLLLLDLMLPGEDGLTVCRRVRQDNDVPVIMVTAKVEEIDRLLGLELGADDYICKPFSPREVVARVKAVLRRPRQSAGRPATEPLFTLEAERLLVHAHGRQIQLTPIEFQLLKTLSSEPGRIFSRDHLMDLIYPDRRVVSDRTVDSHIKKLRRKLAELPLSEELIHSVYGAGYRLQA